MARSAGGPRVRYIGFRLHADAPVDRKAIIEAIRRAGRIEPDIETAAPWLTRFDGTLGVIRCTHTGVETTRRILDRIDGIDTSSGPVGARIETLQTAGTIRSLTEGRLARLQDTGKR